MICLQTLMFEVALNHAEPVEARWLVWGRSAFAVAVVARARRAGRRQRRDVLAVARGRGRRAVGRARRRRHRGRRAPPDRPARPPASSAGDVLLAVNGAPVETPADVVEYQHRGHDGHAAGLHAAAARHAAGARGHARAGDRAAARCTSCSPPSGCSRCWSARRCGCAGRAIRRRCISSGCASRSSASFTFSFNGPFDRLDWVFYWGDAVAIALLPPLLLHFTLVFPQRAGRDASPRRHSALMLLMYLPALVLGAARVIAVARASQGSLSGPLFSRVLELLDRSRAGLPVRLRGRGARRAGARRSRQITSVTGAAAAALDRVGHGARRRAVRVRLRAAVGARRRPAARAAADRHSARPRAADLRVARSSATGCATSR